MTAAPPTDEQREETRHRLLRAAATVFARDGYRKATVRDICHLAGANIAAVNYHFGDKARLYSETLRHAKQAALQKHPFFGHVPETAPPRQRLEAFVLSLLRRIFDSDEGGTLGNLMTHEMIEPSHALDELVEEEMRPQLARLVAVIQEIAGKPLPPIAARSCVMSILGQVLFYKHCSPVICRVAPDVQYGEDELKRLAHHIARFSIAGIRETARQELRPS